MPLNPVTMANYKWITRLETDGYANTNHTYTTPQDTEENGDSEQTYTTMVVCGTPLRETKCLFVTEMNDFYTDQELNTLYHSADEYRNAILKYGYIYKSQKFENADTPVKLLEYATDWVKNNYHGGITSFSINALDMHNAGVDTDKYLVGQRVMVCYPDPILGEETQQTLTIISAEYDLYSPDKNNYKIGIPDVAMKKVYGETSSKSGGGGGGGKTTDENDTEVEVDEVEDTVDEADRQITEIIQKMIYKNMKNGDSGYDLGDSQTPGQANPLGNYTYNLTADGATVTQLKAATVAASGNVVGKYIRSEGGLDANKLGVNSGSITSLTSGKIENSGNISTQSLDITNLLKTGQLSVGGTTVSFGASGGKPQITINGVTYTMETVSQ